LDSAFCGERSTIHCSGRLRRPLSFSVERLLCGKQFQFLRTRFGSIARHRRLGWIAAKLSSMARSRTSWAG
jgi:hypothetical protein